MTPLINLDSIQKDAGSDQLFSNLSFGLLEKEKIALLGRNGSGKSTLLKIISGLEEPDEGNVVYRKNLQVSYVMQSEKFETSEPAHELITNHLVKKLNLTAEEAEVRSYTYLSLLGFEDYAVNPQNLSGGWLKKLSLAKSFAEESEVYILDEPTNHLDWNGILWLEKYLKNLNASMILVSHDREFLNATTNKTLEINKAYPNGFLASKTSYEVFLSERQSILDAQMKQQSSMANKARREVEWLRAGVKARTTKSQGRIKEAHELLDQLSDLKSRNSFANKKSQIKIQDTGRQTKKLFELQNVSVGYDKNSELIKDLNLILKKRQTLGIVGHNGSGKTTLIKTLMETIPPLSGKLKYADDLKIVYFEQKKESLPLESNLMNYLGDGSDHVTFNNTSIHVASYASKFLFPSEKMKLPLKQLSGGEKAKLFLAKELLQPADILILDEPTNDLDIETIEILEQILLEFSGLVILISHDRSLLRNLCDQYLHITGKKEWQLYADLNQWLSQEEEPSKKKTDKTNKGKSKAAKLSYKEKKFLETIEAVLLEEEQKISDLNIKLQNAVKNTASQLIQDISLEISTQQAIVDGLYEKWSALEKKEEDAS